MQITIKLYAMLSDYLPPGAVRNVSTLELEDNDTVDNVITRLRLPRDLVHLVLVNGTYVAPEQRTELTLNEQDALAIWPPVAGG
ncbi:MAG: MoaD/ThiS family protein [Candidatus Competibacteraceae bacterium]|jgi:sulfur carrier protein ThiS|nr:MoaD/ThiS family protein [Candidatus Competibacteraceae bacterium]